MSDKIKPHSPQAEQAFLGCMLAKQDLLNTVLSEYPNGEELFYDCRHLEIFTALRDLGNNDTLGLIELLRNRGQLDQVGGVPYVGSLVNGVVGLDAELWQAGAILVRDYMRRRLIEIGYTIQQSGYETEDAAAALESAERSVMEIGQKLQADSDPEIKMLCREALDEMQAAFDNQGKIRGLQVGFPDFDWLTYGLKAGQMIVLAARPGVGKTSLAMNMAEHVAVDQRHAVGVFSLEMTGKELTHRMACSRSQIDSQRAQSGKFNESDFPRLVGALGKISSAPLHICEKGGLTISQLSARARRMHQRHKLKLLVIDYLQLMSSRIKGNRNEQITEISNGVKALAKDLRIPVIVLSQLNRDVDKNDREPRLSDLRDSGSIEQDADLVMLLSPKPRKLGEYSQEVDALIPKHRGGPVGKVELLFVPSLTRFESRAKTADVPTHWQDDK
jgi:replicative DNA helicase